MKKRIITAVSVAAVGLTGLTGAGIASAMSASTIKSSQDPLVNALASKFKLSKADVQAVFDQQRQAMDAKRDTKVNDTLSQLVADGKLTQMQSDAIKAKRTELENAHKAEKPDMTKGADSRKADRQAEKTALDSWATSHGINSEYLYLVRGGGHMHVGDKR